MAHDDAGSQRSTKVQDFFLALGRRYPNRAATFNVVSATVNGLLDHLDRIAPILVSVLFYLRAAIAFMQTSWAPIVVGFLLCFFGGTYVLLITAVEAVRLLSWDRLTHSLTVLRRAYMDAEHRYRKEVMMANSRSATTSEILQQQLQQPHSPIFTDNNNNIMSSYSIKLYVFASAADVGEVRAAAQTIFSALLTVVAALRVSMIRSMTLGGAVAKMLRGHTFLDRVLHDVMPADLQQWSTPLADVVLLLITLTAATFLQSFCGIIHTSIRGAFLCVEGFLAVMAEHNVLMPSSNYAHTPEMRELANVHHPRLGAPRSDGDDDDDDGCTSDVLLRLRGEPASFASSFSASTRSDAAASSNSSNKEDDTMKNLNTRSVQAKVMIVLLSSMGICWQLAHRAGAPFPLNLLLLPATMVEYALEWVSCLAIAAPMA